MLDTTSPLFRSGKLLRYFKSVVFAILSNRKIYTVALTGLVLLLLSVITVGCSGVISQQNTGLPSDQTGNQTGGVGTSPPSPSLSSTPGTNSAVGSPPVGKPLSREFLKTTKEGQAILGYLGCIDFDCSEKLSVVVSYGPDIVPFLIQILQNGIDPTIAAELPGDVQVLIPLRASYALGELQDERALEPLITLLENENPLLRAEAATALGKIGSENSLTPLIGLLSDPDQLVRETSAQALAKLGNPEALPALRRAAETEPQQHVRTAIETAIQELEGR